MPAILSSPMSSGLASHGSRRLLGGSELCRTAQQGTPWPASVAMRPARAPLGSEIVKASGGGRRPQLYVPPTGSATAADLYLPFRPPAQERDETSNLSSQERLDILRERRGLWHEYAPLLTSLQREGFAPSVIDEVCGMNGVEQNTIVVATQVYKSLQASGMPPSSLAYFDAMGAEVLYELRTLSAEERCDAANYVIRERLDAKGARELSKAMREHERRKREEGRASFSTAPGDCLAFALYRQSKECRSDAEKEATLTKALAKAETAPARAKLEYALGIGEGEEPPEPLPVVALLPIVRLLQDETVSRPVPVLGKLEELDAAAMESASIRSDLEGPFRLFTPALGCQWISLPGWPSLLNAKEPVAILVTEAHKIPAIEIVKSADPLLLVVDRGSTDVNAESYYVVPSSSSEVGLTLAAGSAVAASKLQTFGRVLLTLLPPAPASNDQQEWE